MEKEKEKIVEFFEKHSWLENILSLILWFKLIKDKINLILRNLESSWLDRIIAYFTKKRDRIREKIQEDEEFYDLCAVDNEKDKKCGELLKWGLENKKVNNIAVTGLYGSGKTSFLRSFENNHKEYKYLNISLASFKEDENNEKTIEENILQQILYKVNGSKMPYSRIKRIKELSFKNFLFDSFSLYIWSNVLYGIFLNSKLRTFKELFLLEIPEDKKYLYLPFIFLSVLLIFQALSLFKSFNIKIKAFDSEFQLSNNDEASVFYMYLDEIIYFFKKTKYDVVYFEDIDRFEKINLDLFTKLRELNGLLNQSEDIKRPINFVYAVKDDLFEESWVKEKKEIRNGNLTEIVEKEINITNENSDKLRTKFFDLIVPIIPVINVSNSYEKIIEKLKKVKNLTVSDEFDSDLRTYSYYIDDMRLINNIYNEFIVYKDNLIKINKIKPENQNEFCRTLFAFIVYKNKYPRDFSELHYDKGIISEVFRKKTEILQKKISEKWKEVDKIKALIELAKKESLQDLKELRTIFCFHLYVKKPNALSYENESISNLINDGIKFENLIELEMIRYQEKNSYYNRNDNINLIKFSDLEKELKIDYNNRKNAVENKKENRIEHLKKDIELINKEVYEIRELSLYECLKKYGTTNILEMINNDKLLEFLLESGLIEEKSYKHYISYFYGERYSREDFDFVESVKRGKALSPLHKLSNFSEIFKDLNASDFNKKEILNYLLIDEIIKIKAYDSTKYDNIFYQLRKNSADLIEFFYDYIKNSTIKLKAQRFLIKDIPNYWDLMIEQSNFPKEKLEEVLFSIFKYGDISDLVIQNTYGNISKFFYERVNTIELLEKFWSEDRDKAKDFINKLNINVKILNPTENSEAFEYIYNNNLYDISIDNIENIAKVVCEDSEIVISDLRDRNYTTIKNTDTLEPLHNHIIDNFKKYIEDVFLAITTNTNEVEDAVLEILNADDELLSLEFKNKVIEKEYCIYTDILKIENEELWENVFDKFKIQPTWKNIPHYFVHKDEKIDDILLKFFNNIEFSEELSKGRINQEFDNRILEKLSTDIIKNEEINSSSFKKLASSLYTYGAFGMNDFSESRMDDIIECNIFSLKVKIVEELKKNFPEKVLKFLLSKLDLFLEELNDYKEVIEIKDYENVFTSDEISEEQKFNFINNFDISFLDKEESLFNEFKEYLKKLELLNYFNEEQLIRTY